MNLIIIEYKAHYAGHYTQELNQFCRHINEYFPEIIVLTPFGFKDEWSEIKNCKVEKLCHENEKGNPHRSVFLFRIYNYQWEFYKKVFKYVGVLPNNENIIHIWDITSIFPIWYFFRKIKNRKILNLKSVYRERVPLFGMKSLGKIQGLISNKLLLKIADKYIVHTAEIFNEAVKIGIAKEKIYQIGIGVENSSINLNQDDARTQLNLPKEFFILLFFGVVRKEKGIYELFGHIKEIQSDFILYVVGENNLSESVAELVERFKIKTEVIIEPQYIPEHKLEKYFRASDAVIICHNKEFKGESGVLLKALQYQIPIIANLGSNSAKIIETQSIGSVFDISTQGSILKAVSSIQQNKKIIEANLMLTKQEYSWDKLIHSFESIYFFGL
ncbi:MAG: glycosyltransferase [Ignavibacteriaceae bacterium]